jgi:dienelactone hydrolase
MRHQHGWLIVCGMLVPLAVHQASIPLAAQTWQDPPQVVPNTEPLTWSDPLDVRLMDGAHRYIEQKIAAARAGRGQYWNRDCSSPDAYQQSIAPNRERFRHIIGAVDRGREVNHNIGLPALPVAIRMEHIGADDSPALLAETDAYRVLRVRWPVLKGIHGEGLLLEPKQPPRAHVVAIPDADQIPEQLAGLAAGLPAEQQVARRLAENGVRVVVPVVIDRGLLPDAKLGQTRREWIYRQAFHMGRHIIGYEVQKVQAAVDWLEVTASTVQPVGVAGYGEGGLLAFYAAAIDPRIDAVLVSGYFGPRETVWSEPIYRNVWSLLHEFGDAEIASLIAPRPLIVEYSAVPAVTDQKGDLRTPSWQQVREEAARIDTLTRPDFQPRHLIHGPDGAAVGPWSEPALHAFAQRLGCPALQAPGPIPDTDVLPAGQADARQLRGVWELDDYTQWLVRDSDHVRQEFFLNQVLPEFKQRRWSTQGEHPTSSPQEFAARTQWYRDYFWEEILGKFHDPLLPPKPRTQLIAREEHWVAYNVVLDVFPDLIAWGILMLPKDLEAGQRRPVVVLQHGRDGTPYKVMEGAYNQAADRLLQRGFIVYAPHNLYRGEDRYRWLDRKANSVKASLFSFILAQHDQTTRWLASLPFVDGRRIGFYGNSYGGETAVRVPPILPQYALSICASDFNDWTRKVADTHDRHSFMNTIEWEMPYFNMGSTFSYAEMVYLMVPRPFMVERGHHDTVAPDHWVAYEFAKVRWLYDQLGLPNRRDIEFFQGGHTMKGNQTFEFLHRHLNWPRPETD